MATDLAGRPQLSQTGEKEQQQGGDGACADKDAEQEEGCC